MIGWIAGFAPLAGAMFKTWRLWIYGALAASIITAGWFGFWKLHDEIKQSGVDECRAATYQANEAAIRATSQKIRTEYQAALEASEARRVRALDLVKTLESRSPEIVYREIYKVAASTDCRALGPDFVRVYNQALGIDTNADGTREPGSRGGSDRGNQ